MLFKDATQQHIRDHTKEINKALLCNCFFSFLVLKTKAQSCHKAYKSANTLIEDATQQHIRDHTKDINKALLCNSFFSFLVLRTKAQSCHKAQLCKRSVSLSLLKIQPSSTFVSILKTSIKHFCAIVSLASLSLGQKHNRVIKHNCAKEVLAYLFQDTSQQHIRAHTKDINKALLCNCFFSCLVLRTNAQSCHKAQLCKISVSLSFLRYELAAHSCPY